MRVFHLIDEFFENTTIHGFAYIHSRHPKTFRLLWVRVILSFSIYIVIIKTIQALVVLIGLMLSAFLISQAFQGWADEPTITTLDTIAAPIDDIQFPTVTICNDYIENHPDNWAFLENVLNQFRFQCYNENDCNMTMQLRKDFKYVIEDVVDTFTEWLFEEENLKQSYRILDAPRNEKKNIHKIVHLLHEMASNGTHDFDGMMKYPADYFMMKLDVFMNELGLQKDNPSIEIECESPSCIRIKVLGHLIHQVTKHLDSLYEVKFGSFLRNFVSYKSFSLTKSESLNKPFLSSKSICSFPNFRSNEKRLHKFFANPSSLIGFNEKISLFELPGMLSNLEDLRKPKLSQISTFEKCQKHSSYSLKNINSCSELWSEYLEQYVLGGNSNVIS